MTSEVKDELSRLPVTKSCCRKAEVSSLLRFGGGIHIVAGRIVVEADLDAGATARRLRKDDILVIEAEPESLAKALASLGLKLEEDVASEGIPEAISEPTAEANSAAGSATNSEANSESNSEAKTDAGERAPAESPLSVDRVP
jgi:hypothetical protein